MSKFGKGSLPDDVLKLVPPNSKVMAWQATESGLLLVCDSCLVIEAETYQWDLISSASFDPPVLSLSIGRAVHKFVLNPAGVKDQNELPTAIRERVTNAIVAQNTIEYQDSLKVWISARRNFLGQIRYVISADQGIDTTDLEFKTWSQEQLKEFKEAFGV